MIPAAIPAAIRLRLPRSCAATVAGLFVLGLLVTASPALAAFEWWRPSEVDAQPGLRLEVEQPFSWPGLRIDRVRYRTDVTHLHAGQLSTGGYQEFVLGGGRRFGGFEAALDARITTATEGAATDGLLSQYGCGFHLGWRFSILGGVGRVLQRDALGVGIPSGRDIAVEWSGKLSHRTRLHLLRTWEEGTEAATGRVRVEWNPWRRLELGLSLEPGRRRWRAQLGSGRGIGVEVWEESYASLPPSRGLGLVWSKTREPENEREKGRENGREKGLKNGRENELDELELRDLDADERTLDFEEEPWIVPDSLEVWEEELAFDEPDRSQDSARSITASPDLQLPIVVRSVVEVDSAEVAAEYLAWTRALARTEREWVDEKVGADMRGPTQVTMHGAAQTWSRALLPYMVVRSDDKFTRDPIDGSGRSRGRGFIETRRRSTVAPQWSARFAQETEAGRLEVRLDVDRARPWTDGRGQWLWSHGENSWVFRYGFARGRGWLDRTVSSRRRSKAWMLQGRTARWRWSADREGVDLVRSVGRLRLGLRMGDESGGFVAVQQNGSEISIHDSFQSSRFVRGKHLVEARGIRWRVSTTERWGSTRSLDLRERGALVFDRSLVATLTRERTVESSGWSPPHVSLNWRWKKSKMDEASSLLQLPDAVESRDLGMDVLTRREGNALGVRARLRKSGRRRDGNLTMLRTWYGRLHWDRSVAGAEAGARGQVRGESQRLHSWIGVWTRVDISAIELRAGGIEVRGPKDRRVSIDPLGFDGRPFSASGGSFHLHGSGVVRRNGWDVDCDVLWSLSPESRWRMESRVRFSL